MLHAAKKIHMYITHNILEKLRIKVLREVKNTTWKIRCVSKNNKVGMRLVSRLFSRTDWPANLCDCFVSIHGPH